MSSTTNHRTDAETSSAEGVAGTARDEAGHLTETSADAAKQVAGAVKDKASSVTSDAAEQTRKLAGQTRDELVQQAGQQKDRAANGLRAVGDELRGMAEHGQSGLGTQLANHGADFTNQAADFLEKHEPGDLLNEVRGYARRKPGTFLLIAAAAGMAAGRLTRALSAGATETAVKNTTASSTPSSDGMGATAPSDDYLVPPPVSPVPHAAPMSTPPIGETSPPPPMPMPTPTAPDLGPGTPVTPRFGPGQAQ